MLKLTLLAVVLSACTPTTRATVESDAIDCATQDVGKTVTEVGLTLLADVAIIVEAGAQGWKDALDALGKKYGGDAVACAAKDVLDALAHTDTTQPGAHADAMARAQAFLAGKRFK